MIVGAELQAKADAEAAIELADAARGAALLEALATLTEERRARRSRSRAPPAAAAVVRALVDAGLRARRPRRRRRSTRSPTRGIVEQALLHGAAAEAEELLAQARGRAAAARRMSDAPSGTRRSPRGCATASPAPDADPRRVRRACRATSSCPALPLDAVYADDAVVTHDEGGVPTSSSSQPSLMARMLDQLDVRAGDRVLEIGAGTGYNAALLAALGAAVTTVELQPEVAGGRVGTCARRGRRRRDHGDPHGAATARSRPARCASSPATAPRPPGGPYDRVIVTAGCWSLPAALVAALADGGMLVAPLRVNGVELVLALRREGDVLRGARRPPVRLHAACAAATPGRGAGRSARGGFATADADLGVEGRGALDRLLATPGARGRRPARPARPGACARRAAVAGAAGRSAALARAPAARRAGRRGPSRSTCSRRRCS